MNHIYKEPEFHLQMLAYNGYTAQGLRLPQLPDFVSRLFDNYYREISRAVRQSGELRSFVLPLQGFFDANQDEVNYKILYRCHPKDLHLRAICMTAALGEFRKMVFFGNSNEPQNAKILYQQLSNMRTEKVLEMLSQRKVNTVKLNRTL